MAANYEVMPLAAQLKIMGQEAKNTNMLEAKSTMWNKAGAELGKAGKEIGKETDKLEPDWKDTAGQQFVERARNTEKTLAKWHHNITTAKPDQVLGELATLIPTTHAALTNQIKQFDLWYAENQEALTKEGYTREGAEIYPPYNWRQLSGSMMNRIADLYGRATKAVDTASSGGKYEGVNDQVEQKPPKRPSVTGGTDGGTGGTVAGAAPTGTPAGTPVGVPSADLQGTTVPRTDLPQTGPNGVNPTGNPQVTAPNGVSPTGSPQVTAPNLTGGPDVGGDPALTGQSEDPQLSGGLGGTPPVSAPTVPTAPPGGGAVPPGGGGGGVTAPVIPPVGGVGGGPNGVRPVIPPIGGGPGGGPGGGGPGVGSGGVKLPGVSLGGVGGGAGIGAGGVGSGGGGSGVGGVGVSAGGFGAGAGSPTIPAASTPVQAPATAAPAVAAPTTPPGLSSTTGGTAMGGGGGMPPMMPPMGMGAGGAGGGPGAGTGSRASGNGRNNRRKDVVTPGLPVMLSGKAGWADVNAFAGRGRRQTEESDVPTTVQLIDEDLWQVDQKPAADERITAPTHRAH
ncbi:hypothetical protein [Actinophytocola sediminis]